MRIEPGECPEWQRELTVNQPPHGFEGSSPSSPTILLRAKALRRIESCPTAKQDALRSLGVGGLLECTMFICCKVKPLRTSATSA